MRSSRSTTPSRPSYVKQDHGLASLTNMDACHGANNFISRSMTIGYAFTAPPPSQTHQRKPFMVPHAAPLYPQKQHHFTTKTIPLYPQKQYKKKTPFYFQNYTTLPPKQHHFTPKSAPKKQHHFTSKTAPTLHQKQYHFTSKTTSF